MVQQQQQQQQQQQSNGFSLEAPLALPANGQQQIQQQQYSPQSSLYQQQLIKSAQQFIPQPQQQQVAATRHLLNGISNGHDQQHSPQQQIYNNSVNNSRQQQQQQQQQHIIHQQQQQQIGSIYGPKPSFYQPAMNGTSQQQLYHQAARQPMNVNNVNATQQYYGAPQPQTQQQQSPNVSALMFAGAVRQQQQQQMPPMSQLVVAQSLVNISPANQQQPPTFLNQPWTQQQQQQPPQQQQTNDSLAQSTNLQYHQQQQQVPLNNYQANVWPQQQQQQQQQATLQRVQLPVEASYQQQQQVAAMSRQEQMLNQRIIVNTKQHQSSKQRILLSSRFSDRDSISTISRIGPSTLNNNNNSHMINNDIDHRSFTMRSQFTSYQSQASKTSQFSFMQLTGEAVRHLLGLGENCRNRKSTGRQPLLSALESTQTGGLNQPLPGTSPSQEHHQSTTSKTNKVSHQEPPPLVTAIDSGDDYYFRRKVFKYQLAILRLINSTLSAFVLLSPVIMLLLPKMETILPQLSSLALSSSNPNPEDDPYHQAALASSQTSGVVTHGLGLNHKFSSLQRSLTNNNNNNKPPQQLAAITPASPSQATISSSSLVSTGQQQAPQWKISECVSSECDGPLIGFVLRLILLAGAHWAIFFRQQTVTLPRVDFQRCFLITLALLITLAYWLFFVFRVFDKRYNDFELHYMTVIQFSISMLESLILLHYLALVLLDLRQRKKIYCLKVVRSPDGESKYYTCGLLSIQQCGQFVLEQYHQQFKHYDALSEQMLAQESELARRLLDVRKRHETTMKSNNNDDNEDDIGGNNNSNYDEDDDDDRRHHHHHHHHNHRRSRSRRESRGRHSSSRDCFEEPERSELDEDEQAERSSRRGQRRAHKSRRRSESRREAFESEDNNDDGDDGDDLNGDGSARRAREHQQQQQQKASIMNGKHRDESTVSETEKESTNNDKMKTELQQQQTPARIDANSSSDASQKLKESSLETVRAANESGQQQQSLKLDLEISEQPKHQQQTSSAKAAELESVRSGRSRRSTGSRLHKSRHSGHHNNNNNNNSHQHKRHGDRRERSAARQGDEDQELARSPVPRRSASRSRSRQRLEQADDELQLELGNLESQLFEEQEKKLRRRKLRLLASVEEAFGQMSQQLGKENVLQQHQTADGSASITVPHQQQQHQQQQKPLGMDANQAARSMYPSIARALQKYLRASKQTGRHNLQSIYEHLAKCLLYKLNARAFLEKFFQLDPVWQQNETKLFAQCRMMSHEGSPGSYSSSSSKRHLGAQSEPEINSWSLICDTLLSRQIDSGTFFVLRQGQISLLVTVAKLPHLHLTEQVLDQNLCRFTQKATPNGMESMKSV